MSVSLLMGLGLLAVLILFVLFLVLVLVFAGRSGKRSAGRHSAAQTASEAPTNVFLRGVVEPAVPVAVAAASPVVGYRPAAPAPEQAQFGRSALNPELGGAGTGRWYPGMGAAQLPAEDGN